MERRKSPADPGARRVLVELAQDTREQIRECRLAIEYYEGLPDGAGSREVAELFSRIAGLRELYVSGRDTLADVDSIGDSALAGEMRQHGIELAPPKGLPPEKLLRYVDYERVMARRQRIAAAANQPRRRSIPPKRGRAR